MLFGTVRPLLSAVPLWEKWIVQFEQSGFYQFLTYIKNTYFTVNFHIYEHISIGPSENEAAQMLIFGLAIGLIIAVILTSVTKKKLGAFFAKLIGEDCLSSENAKTLSELGEFRNASIRRQLAKGVTLRKFVKCREEDAFWKNKKTVNQCNDEVNRCDEVHENESSAPSRKPKSLLAAVKRFFTGRDEDDFKMDFTTMHFYLPEELKDRAEIRFVSRKGSGWLPVLLAILGAVFFTALTCRFLPDILQLMDNIINQMAP